MRNPFTFEEWGQLVALAVTLAALAITVVQRKRRMEAIKAQYERIRGTGKCDGAAAVPEGAEKLLTTDETDGMIKQGQVWLKDRSLYISSTLLGSDSLMLASCFGGSCLRISLDDVEDCRVNQWTIELGMPSVPCLVTFYHDFSDKHLEGREKLFAALRQNLKCKVETQAKN